MTHRPALGGLKDLEKWQHFFTLSWTALKKPSRKFNYNLNVVVDTGSGSRVPLEPKGLGLITYLVGVGVVPLLIKPLLIR